MNFFAPQFTIVSIFFINEFVCLGVWGGGEGSDFFDLVLFFLLLYHHHHHHQYQYQHHHHQSSYHHFMGLRITGWRWKGHRGGWVNGELDTLGGDKEGQEKRKARRGEGGEERRLKLGSERKKDGKKERKTERYHTNFILFDFI